MSQNETDVPIFLITGFLESGKTSFINYTLQDPDFEIDGTTLLIVCEEGETEYDEAFLLKHNTVMEVLNGPEDFTFENLKAFKRKYRPERVLIEFNALWTLQAFADMDLPLGWGIVQQIVIVDASTFGIYMNNMKSIFVDMSRDADMVAFNRCKSDMPLANYRRSIKVVNPACMVLFEDENGMIDTYENFIPYDVSADPIEVADEDFGILFVEMDENPEIYEGKRVRFKGRVLKSQSASADFFVPGRQAMTCCAEDTSFIGYLCKFKNARKLKMGAWVTVTAKIEYQYVELYGSEGPVLYAEKVEPAEPPQTELVYFN